MIAPLNHAPHSDPQDPVVCRCLRVHRSTIAVAIESQGLKSVREVSRCRAAGGAGGGCMVCHCTIRQMLAERANLAEAFADSLLEKCP